MNDYSKIKGTNCYYITNDGYVFKKVGDYNFKKLAISYLPSGYCQSFIKYKDGKWRSVLIHQLVARHFIQKPKYKRNLELHHVDGDKSNNHVNNLQWVSRQQNMQLGWESGAFDAVRKSIIKKRKQLRHHVTNLTHDDVRQIRRLRSQGLSNRELGFVFVLHPMQISRICNFRSFASVL